MPCLKCFYQTEPSDQFLNCESEGILGSTANIVGAMQANEVLKIILGIGKNLKTNIFILDFLNLNFRKVLFKKEKLYMQKGIIYFFCFFILFINLFSDEKNLFNAKK